MNNNTPASNRTGLWVRDSKQGHKYMSGTLKIGDVEYSIRIFKNEKKEKPSQPDYSMFYDLKEKKETTDVKEEDVSVSLSDEDIDKMFGNNEEETIPDSMLPF